MSKSGKAAKKTTVTNNSEENSASASSSAAPVYRYKDVDFSNAEVSELNREGRQPLAYVNYNDPVRNAQTKILVQTGKFKLTSHGIPQLDKEGTEDGYYPDDSKREFIKIPLDPDQPQCVELRKHIQAADEWAGSEEMKKKLFGKRAKEYQYQPSIKTPKKPVSDDDDDDDDKPKGKGKGKGKGKDSKPKKEYPIIDYVKMKFNVVSQGKGRVNMTKLKKVDGKTKTVVKADTITEIANEVKFLSEIRLVFYYNKIWANKTAAQGAQFIAYGLGFKVMAIEYTPSPNKGLNSAEIDFLSEEEDEDEVPSTKKPNPKAGKQAQKLDDSDAEENEDNEDNEEEEEEKPKRGSKSGKTQDESSKGKSKESTKGKGKSSKKVEDEDEEEQEQEEDEEEVPVKKPSPKKGASGKSKKPKVEDEDEEEEEEEEEEEIKSRKRSGKGRSSSRTK
ncbi:hypothetical protein QJ856_gp0511 [Tupanvirus deep ocean]|uniref:thymidylate synthase n=1 Tax=Tupanvirus soda lake TaxID=2126985 RepID=A0A2K9L1F7_9VIRU|nr:hypothetical protein QJ856_gp0511 [Tupanvirus deep ocean]AUL79603.2 hypothetical protein [Tupanvirus deep ocean]